MEAKLYIGNLSYESTVEHLSELFMQAGGVLSVAIIKDRHSGQPKGFAFVEMSSQADAQKAINMFNGHTLNDRQLAVNNARPQEERGGFRPQNKKPHKNRGGSGNQRY